MRWVAMFAWVFALGCVESVSVPCDNGIVCPRSQVCSPLGGCVLPEQLAACDPMPADGVCTLPDGATGGCFSGVCMPTGCGNAIVEPGEACDDGNTEAGDGCSATCDSDERCGNGFPDVTKSEGCDCGDASLPDAMRPPACAGQPNSSQQGARCTETCQIVGCGDGVIGGLEDCDGSDLGNNGCTGVGFYGGTLACQPNCKFDVTACTGACGDGIKNGPSMAEACDQSDLGGADCTDYGFYNPNGLTCNEVCGIDVSACTGRCDDGAFDAGDEACDPVESEAALGARGFDCKDFGFYTAAGLSCDASCQFDTSACSGGFCGDGVVDAGEDCDGTALGASTCATFGYYAGTPSCRSNCTYDVSTCSQRCGDNLINGTEACDGPSMPASTTCQSFGFYSGTLACNEACGISTAACSQRCGDGAINGLEQCDGSSLGGADCTDFGFHSTAGLACSGGCTYDVSACTGGRCGDGALDAGYEDCEAPSTGGFDCTDFGFYQPGGLVCTAACNFDQSGCKEWCGDDLVNGSEACDGGPPATFACVSKSASGGLLGCSSGCFEARSRCYDFGFKPEYPGDNVTVRDAWGIGDELFAAGTKILHTNGGAWSAQATFDTDGVWGSSRSNVFAVGKIGASPWGIYRYDGTSWSPMAGPASPVALHDVFGFGANDVWAVGDNGTVLHYTGSSWARDTSANSSLLAGKLLRGVWGTSSTNLFVVGDDGARFRLTGSGWVSDSLVTTADFTAVWGRSANEVFAVSSGSVYTYNGSNWTTIPPAPCGQNLTGVGGLPGPAVAVAVGIDGNGRGYACQLAGGVWHMLELPSQAKLNGVGGSERKLLLAGDSTIFTSTGVSRLPTIAESTGLSESGAIWGTNATNIYVVGRKNTASLPEGIVRWTGSSWVAQTISPTDAVHSLLDVFGGSSWAVAVGDSGHILSSNGAGGTWTAETSGTTVELHAVWGDTTSIYVVGDTGTIKKRATSGGSWATETGITTQSLYDVWGVPGGPVFAVGNAGTILRNVGGTWSAMTSGTTAGLFSVWGRSATDVYALGNEANGSLLLHFNGTAWTRMAAPEGLPTGSLHGNAIDMLAASGTKLQQLQGGRWLPMALPFAIYSIRDLFAMSDMLLMVSDRGVVAYAGRTWSPTTTETNCTDQWDDDADGLIDCADPQCSAKPECAGAGACRPATVLACGQSVTTTTVGGSTRYPHYGSGCIQRDDTGNERYFTVKRPTAGSIKVDLTGFAGRDLDLVVSSATASGACTPEQRCLAASQKDGNGVVESATLTAVANTDYTVIVDGYNGSSGAFTLQVTCP